MTEQDDSTQPRNKRKHILSVFILCVVIALVGFGTYWMLIGRFYADTGDAYVEGNLVMLTPRISGTVITINTDDTQFVHQGDPIVGLDKTDALIAYQDAKANLAETVREVRQLFNSYQESQENITQRKAELIQAERDYKRDLGMLEYKAVSVQDFQHAETTLRTTQAMLAQAQSQLAANRASIDHTTLETHPRVLLAEAQLRNNYYTLQRTKISAPISGYVANRSVQVGQQITAGTQLLAIVPLHEVWVTANFKETELKNVKIGQPVKMYSDFYGRDIVFHGFIEGLAAGTGNAFALLPAQNATGNWIKIVQRVPVRIKLVNAELDRYPLRVGLSMNVTVDTHNRHGKELSELRPVKPVYVTPIYDDNGKTIDSIISDIIRKNSAAETEKNSSEDKD